MEFTGLHHLDSKNTTTQIMKKCLHCVECYANTLSSKKEEETTHPQFILILNLNTMPR